MDYKWIETTASVYRAVYESHKDQFTVFESYTSIDEETDKLKAQITAWGFKDSGHPIIRSEMNNFTEWKYSLIHKVEFDD